MLHHLTVSPQPPRASVLPNPGTAANDSTVRQEHPSPTEQSFTTDVRASPVRPPSDRHSSYFLLLLALPCSQQRPCFSLPLHLKNTCPRAQPPSISSSLPVLQRTLVFSFPWCQPQRKSPLCHVHLDPPLPWPSGLMRPSNPVPSLGLPPQTQVWFSPSPTKTVPSLLPCGHTQSLSFLHTWGFRGVCTCLHPLRTPVTWAWLLLLPERCSVATGRL